MTKKVLVAYATHAGSTEEVAEVVTVGLREAGLDAELQAAKDVRSVAGYDAVVVGAPIYIGQWQKPAHDLLKRHAAALREVPVAVFCLGPTDTAEKDMAESVAQFEAELAKHDWLTPVAQQTFVGRFDPSLLKLPYKLLFALPANPLKDLPTTDHRDWEAIVAWTKALAATLMD